MSIRYHDATTAASAGAALDDAGRVAKLAESMRLASFPAGAEVLHIKGFASGIIPGPEYDRLTGLLIDEVKRRQYTGVVWDGDDYNEGSFTALLPRIRLALPHVRFAAVLIETDRYERGGNPKGFDGSWSQRDGMGDIDCFLVDRSVKVEGGFAALGWLALRATRGMAVFSFGGGMVVKDEHAHMVAAADATSSAGVEYVLFDVVRINKRGPPGVEERSSLVGVVPSFNGPAVC